MSSSEFSFGSDKIYIPRFQTYTGRPTRHFVMNVLLIYEGQIAIIVKTIEVKQSKSVSLKYLPYAVPRITLSNEIRFLQPTLSLAFQRTQASWLSHPCVN